MATEMIIATVIVLGTVMPVSEDPYFMANPNSYGESGGSYQGQACVGNATWTLIPATGDPECGVKHAVNRCRPTSNGCAIISGTTTDIAEQ